MPRDWQGEIMSLLASREERPLQLAGVGNPVKSDDGVGLYIASELRKACSSQRFKGFKILSAGGSAESMFAKLDLMSGNVLIIDAVECNRKPGTVILADLSETRYGFFATHNVPLRLVPELQSNQGKTFILGIQPQSTEIGETLTPTVKSSAEAVIETVITGLEAP